jgi:hypothetical protein
MLSDAMREIRELKATFQASTQPPLRWGGRLGINTSTEPSTRTPDPKPSTLNPQPQTLHPKPQAPNYTPQIPNTKPQTPNTKHQTPNTKPQTPNTKPPNTKHQTQPQEIAYMAGGTSKALIELDLRIAGAEQNVQDSLTAVCPP